MQIKKYLKSIQQTFSATEMVLETKVVGDEMVWHRCIYIKRHYRQSECPIQRINILNIVAQHWKAMGDGIEHPCQMRVAPCDEFVGKQ